MNILTVARTLSRINLSGGQRRAGFSSRLVVRVDGTGETIRNIGAFEMRLKQEAIQIVKQHAKDIKKEAKSRVPVSPASRTKSSGRPGDLKRSISSRSFNDGLSAVVYPKKAKGPHRGIVEAGTGPRRTKSGANRGRGPAQPFMDPARRAREASYEEAMIKLFEGEDTTV